MFHKLSSRLDSIEKNLMQEKNRRLGKYILGLCISVLLFLSISQSALNDMLREMHQGIPYGLEELQFNSHNPHQIMTAWREYDPWHSPDYIKKVTDPIIKMLVPSTQLPLPETLPIIFWRTLALQFICILLWLPVLFFVLIRLRIELQNKIATLPNIFYKTFLQKIKWITSLLVPALIFLFLFAKIKVFFTALHFLDLNNKNLTPNLEPASLMSGFICLLAWAELIFFRTILIVSVLSGLFIFFNGKNLLKLGRILLLLRIQLTVITIFSLIFMVSEQPRDIIRSWLYEDAFIKLILSYTFLLFLSFSLWMLGRFYHDRVRPEDFQLYKIGVQVLCWGTVVVFGLAVWISLLPELHKYWYLNFSRKEIIPDGINKYGHDVHLLYFFLSFAFLQGPLAFIYYTLFKRAYLKLESGNSNYQKLQYFFHACAGLFFLFWSLSLTYWDIDLPRQLGAICVLIIFLGSMNYLLFGLERLLFYLQAQFPWVQRRFTFLSTLGFQHWPVATMIVLWLILMNLSSNYLFHNNKHEVNFIQKSKQSPDRNKQAKLSDLWCIWLNRNNLPTSKRVLENAFTAWPKNYKDSARKPELSHFPDCSEVLRDFPIKTTKLERPKETRKNIIPLIFISSTGGGIRAAYWTADVLSNLSKPTPPGSTDYSLDMRHVFSMSGVSGGALGFTEFIALLIEKFPDNKIPAEPGKGPDAYLQEILGQDYLTPGLTRAVTTEAFQMFLPVNLKLKDRASIMEASWEKSWDKICKRHNNKYKMKNCGLNRPLSTLWSDPRARSNLPLLLNNGVDVTSGSRLNVSVLNSNCGNERQKLHARLRSDLIKYTKLLYILSKNNLQQEQMLKNVTELRLYLFILILAGEQNRLQTQNEPAIIRNPFFGNKPILSIPEKLRSEGKTLMEKFHNTYKLAVDGSGNIIGLHTGKSFKNLERSLKSFQLKYKEFLDSIESEKTRRRLWSS